MGLNLRRKFSDDDKIKILQEGTINGVPQTLRKYGIGQSLFYKWKRAFIRDGVTSLNDKSKDPELIRLQYENEKLKALIGEKEFELKIKDELLKKTLLRNQTRLN
jgi:transposase-like protein